MGSPAQPGIVVDVHSFLLPVPAPSQWGTPVGEEQAGSRPWKEKHANLGSTSNPALCISAACSWSGAGVAVGLLLCTDQPGTVAAMEEVGWDSTATTLWIYPCLSVGHIGNRFKELLFLLYSYTMSSFHS